MEPIEPPIIYDELLFGNCNGLFCLRNKPSNRVFHMQLGNNKIQSSPKNETETPAP